MNRIKQFGEFNEEREPIENLGILHKDAGYARLKKWQDDNAKTPVEIGDWVKIAFIEDEEVEWMWVNIEKVVDADHFEGKLDNDPAVVHNVKIGDTVKVERSQVAQLMKKDE